MLIETTHDLIWAGVFIGFGLGCCFTFLILGWKYRNYSEDTKTAPKENKDGK